MPAFIHAIASHAPGPAFSQQSLCERLLQACPDKRCQRLIRQAHLHAGIEQRHVALSDLHGQPFFFTPGESFHNRTSGERNEIYAREARSLFVTTAERTLIAAHLTPDLITHLVTASCTGFVAPGPDVWIQQDTGMRPDLQRFHLGFMGCYAALPALELARMICTADPAATVLVVAGELCSIHLQPQTDLDAILSAAIFADGAAGAIVSSHAPGASFQLLAAQAAIIPDTNDDITWRITDHGFAMTLSRAVPALLAGSKGCGARDILHRWQWPLDNVAWVIHPGGPAILNSLQEHLALPDSAMTIAREILRDYGNMSSATILFLLERFAAAGLDHGHPMIALGFGPGITMQGLLMEVC